MPVYATSSPERTNPNPFWNINNKGYDQTYFMNLIAQTPSSHTNSKSIFLISIVFDLKKPWNKQVREVKLTQLTNLFEIVTTHHMLHRLTRLSS